MSFCDSQKTKITKMLNLQNTIYMIVDVANPVHKEFVLNVVCKFSCERFIEWHNRISCDNSQ